MSSCVIGHGGGCGGLDVSPNSIPSNTRGCGRFVSSVRVLMLCPFAEDCSQLRPWLQQCALCVIRPCICMCVKVLCMSNLPEDLEYADVWAGWQVLTLLSWHDKTLWCRENTSGRGPSDGSRLVAEHQFGRAIWEVREGAFVFCSTPPTWHSNT